MTIQELLPYAQIIGTIISFAYFIGRYKSMFDEHEKILDKHEKVIDGILVRLDSMNAEVSYMKGYTQGRSL